jgi:hypothetical protein
MNLYLRGNEPTLRLARVPRASKLAMDADETLPVLAKPFATAARCNAQKLVLRAHQMAHGGFQDRLLCTRHPRRVLLG